MSIANWRREDGNPFPNGIKVYGEELSLRDGSGGYMTMRGTDLSSSWINASLPTITTDGTTHPLSVCRLSVFRNEDPLTIPDLTSSVIEFGDVKVNQLNLSFPSLDVIQASPEIEGTFVELYMNMEVSASNNANIAVDISGVDSSFYRVLGTRSVNKAGSYNMNFGTLLVSPDEFAGGNQYKFVIDNFGNQPIDVVSRTLVIKSIVV